MTLNTDPRCKVPQMCRRINSGGVCMHCKSSATHKLDREARAMSAAARDQYYAQHPMRGIDWCPPALHGMYRDVYAAVNDEAEARRILEDHMRARKIPAPGVGV